MNIHKQNMTVVFIFVLICALVISNYNIADYSNYQLVYDYYLPSGTAFSVMPDIGFLFLCKVGQIIGLEFSVFRNIYLVIALFIMFKAIHNLVGDKAVLVYILYLFYPFLLDIAQMRFTLASAIFIYSLKYLQKKDIKKYVIFILLAASQHNLAIVYMIFLLLLLDDNKLKIIVPIAVITQIVIFLVGNRFLVSAVSRYIPRIASVLRLDTYTLKLSAEYLFMSIVVYCFARYVVKNENIEYLSFFHKFCFISICLTPVIILDDNYVRLYRGCLVPIYILLYKTKYSKRYTYVTNIFVLIFVAFMFYIHLSPHNIQNYASVTKAFFENNYLLDLFR